jgi:hypothetical protein
VSFRQVVIDTATPVDLPRIDPIGVATMLHRKLDQYLADQRPVWVFLADQQCWIEEAQVVAIEGDLVTFRYEELDEEDLQSWEISVRLSSIGAVSTRLASVSRSANAEEIVTTGDCPEAERLGSP